MTSSNNCDFEQGYDPAEALVRRVSAPHSSNESANLPLPLRDRIAAAARLQKMSRRVARQVAAGDEGAL